MCDCNADEIARKINKWNKSREETIEKLKEILKSIENMTRDVNIATVVGNSAGIVGSALAIVGIIAAPFTLGVSLGLTVAGASTGIAGGLTSAGSSLAAKIIAKTKCKEAIELLENYKKLTEELESLKIDFNNINLSTTVLNGTNLSKCVINSDAKAASLAGNVMSKAFCVGMAVLSIAIDTVSLIQTSIELANGSRSELAEMLKEVIDKLEKKEK